MVDLVNASPLPPPMTPAAPPAVKQYGPPQNWPPPSWQPSTNVIDQRSASDKAMDDEDRDPLSFYSRSHRNLFPDAEAQARKASDDLQARIAKQKPVPQTSEQLKLGAPAAALTSKFGRGADPNLQAKAPASAYSAPSSVHDSIVRAAKENGLDPATALAIAERESDFKVNGTAPGSSAYGLFQLLKSERATYGGNSQDPYEQATAWARYIQGTRTEMERGLGRPPTGPELYLGHYFGGARAARLVAGQVPGQTPVAAIFSPQELAANPNIGRAGTTGALTSSIMADITRRQGKYAGAGVGSEAGDGADFDPAQWGSKVGGAETATERVPSPGPQSKAVPYTQQEPTDFSKFGAPAGNSPPPPMPSAAPASYIPEQSIV